MSNNIRFNSEAFAAIRVLAGLTILIGNFYRARQFDHNFNVQASDLTFYLYFFLVVHALRVWFGIYFMERDRSFRMAIDRMIANNRHRRNKLLAIQYVVYSGLFGTIALFAVAFTGKWGEAGLALILLVQAALIAIFDVTHMKILVRDDTERNWNWFFIVGDGIVVAVAICYFGKCYDPPNSDWTDVVMNHMDVLTGGLGCMFLGEFLSQYVRDLWQAVKQIRGDFRDA